MSIHSTGKILLALSFVVIASPTFSAEPSTKAKPRVRVTISKETTYITEPLRPDGYPDYIAALNQRMSKGVTPENNAAVLFWKAMGPSKIKPEYRERHFKMLGIPPLPESGDYFVTSDDFIGRHKAKITPDSVAPGEDEEDITKAVWNQMNIAMERPWSKEEFPVWAEWLAANEKPLTLLAEACRRPRRYEPLISGHDNRGLMTECELLAAQESRECARALVMRAMLRTREGKVDEAWSDLLNCHRLARLTDKGPSLVEGLVAIVIESVAEAGDRTLLQHAKVTTAQIVKMRADLNRLPHMSAMSDKIDVFERFIFLDCVSMMAREGPSLLIKSVFDGEQSNGTMESLMDSLVSSAIDWDIPLRMGNSWYDRLVAARRQPMGAERVKSLAKFNEGIAKLNKSAKDTKSIGLSLLGNPRKAISKWMGEILVTLFLPAVAATQNADDRMSMQWDLTKLAFALAAYHADHGSYPTKLADLVPKYVTELPKDIFNNDNELHYTRETDGYLLYSFGSNGKDDGGKDNEDWDDLTVRMSPTAKP